jgi:hypothetical protein
MSSTSGDVDPTDDAKVGKKAKPGSGGWMATAISVMAFIGSALSLWESTIRQAEIKAYVSANIHYLRDPYGSYEVLVVPVTIANRGAREGAVLSLALEVKNSATGQTAKFESRFIGEAQYFGGRDDVTTNQKRPKLPFAPLSVPSHNAFTGTILFYPEDEKKTIEPTSKVEMTLRVGVPPASGWLERLFSVAPAPVTVEAEVPNYHVGRLLSGDMARLKVKSGAL